MTDTYPFTIDWLIDDKVLYAHLERQLNGAGEVERFNAMMLEQIQSVTQSIYLIMDLRHVKMAQFSPISRLHEVGTYRSAPNIEHFITVTDPDVLLEFVTSTVVQMAGKKYTHMNALSHAVNYVIERIHKDELHQLNTAILVELESQVELGD